MWIVHLCSRLVMFAAWTSVDLFLILGAFIYAIVFQGASSMFLWLCVTSYLYVSTHVEFVLCPEYLSTFSGALSAYACFWTVAASHPKWAASRDTTQNPSVVACGEHIYI